MNQIETIFTVLAETEKAIKVNYPYYIVTNEFKKSHTQKYIDMWVPKSVNDVNSFIFNKMKGLGFDMSSKKIGLAPIKLEVDSAEYINEELRTKKWEQFCDLVERKTSIRPTHYRDLMNDDGVILGNDGAEYDFSKEFNEFLNYNPVIKVKRYL